MSTNGVLHVCYINSECVPEYYPGDMTDILQVIDDSRVGNQLKTFLNAQRNAFLESSETAFDEWEAMAAADKRIMYTIW